MRQKLPKVPHEKKTTFPERCLRSQDEGFKVFIRKLVDKINTLEESVYDLKKDRGATLGFFSMQHESACISMLCGQNAQFPTLNNEKILQSSEQEKSTKTKINELKKLLDSCTEYNYHEKEALFNIMNSNQFAIGIR